MKNKIIILTVIMTNIIAIILNFANFFMGNFSTPTNLTVSVFFLLIWIILSAYTYIKKDIMFSKFMLTYWIISMIVSILSIKVSSFILVPFYIIYFAPFYGFTTFFKTYIPTFSFIMSSISVIFVIIAVYINKHFK
ncbi:hypothetical protein [Clostridium sp. AWRP]|uniref:hypothetical protein n=1 Tax=Clostridium sp. AWRP TaxID=2212991 RepID=UPI000FD8688B|nr:hypothetical protein [Clostridium sp. AWRP]AZV56056.1 hypothetical protein DMR38_05285 [Clostridium sp. AWRP]